MDLTLEADAEDPGSTRPVAGGPATDKVLHDVQQSLTIDALLGLAQVGPLSGSVALPQTSLPGASAHFEALEGRLSSQIARVRQQSERQRDAALARMDSRIGAVERASEEVLERHNQRLLRLEQLLDERGTQHEELSNSLASMRVQFLGTERGASDGTLRSASGPAATRDPLPEVAAAVAGAGLLEAQLQELARKVQQLQEGSRDLLSRLESQEEHRRASQAKEDGPAESESRAVREDGDGRLNELQRRLDESAPRGPPPAAGPADAGDATLRERLSALEGALRELQSKVPAEHGSQELFMGDQGASAQDLASRIAELQAGAKNTRASHVELCSIMDRLSGRFVKLEAEVASSPGQLAELRELVDDLAARMDGLENEVLGVAASEGATSEQKESDEEGGNGDRVDDSAS